MINTKFNPNPATGSGLMTRAMSSTVGPRPRTFCFASNDDEFIGVGGTPSNVVDIFTRKTVTAAPTSIAARSGTRSASVQESEIVSLMDAAVSGEDAVEPLCSLVGDNDLDVCLPAVETLGKLGDSRAIEPLLETLETDDRRAVRQGIRKALLGIGGMKVMDAFIKKPLVWLADGYCDEEFESLVAGTGDARVMDRLVDIILNGHAILSQEDSGKVGDLRINKARSVALRILGKTGHPNVVQPLIEVLRRADDSLHIDAICVLGKLGDKRAFRHVLRFFDHEGFDIGLDTVEALKDIDPSRLMDEAFARLGHEKATIRNRAIRALTAIAGERVGDRAIVALSDESADIRRCAAFVLGNISDERATSRLVELLSDVDDGVRGAASYALYEVGHPVSFFSWTPLSRQS